MSTVFVVTYHASGFAYKQEMEAETIGEVEAAAFARLEESRLRVTIGEGSDERSLILISAQVGAVQVEPKAAPPIKTRPDMVPELSKFREKREKVAVDSEESAMPDRHFDVEQAERERFSREVSQEEYSQDKRKPHTDSRNDYRPRDVRDADMRPRSGYGGNDFKPRSDSPRGNDSGFRPRENREGDFKPRENRDGGFRPRENRDNGGFRPRENRDGDFRPRGNGGDFRGGGGGFRPRENRDGDFKPRGGGDFKPRGGGNDFKPRGEFRPRPDQGGSDERRPFRPSGDRPFNGRPQGDRPFNGRPQGDRPSGDRPFSGGDRKFVPKSGGGGGRIIKGQRPTGKPGGTFRPKPRSGE